VTFVPIYCANCGVSGGGVSEGVTFAFWVCSACDEKHGPIADLQATPDTVFWKRVCEAQLEQYGRLLSADEVVQVLDDPSNSLTKLAREAPKGNR
jgi:hypothetical protein